MIGPVKLFNLKKASRKIDINNRNFYDKHPDLAPRNIYLYLGRTLDIEKVNRTIENFDEPLSIRIKNWCKQKIKNIFKKK